MEIVSYDVRYDEQLKRAEPRKFKELKEHGDVIAESAVLAVDGEQCLGVGYLIMDEDVRRPAEETGGVCHIGMEFQAFPEAGEREPEICGMLLEALLDFFDEYADRIPDKEAILRTWCGAKKTAYMEFLMDYGFRAAEPLFVFSRPLFSGDPEFDSVSNARTCLFEKKGTESKEVIVKIGENKLETKAKFEEFLGAMERAFDTPESAENLRYRMKHPKTRIFTASADERTLGGVITWEEGTGRIRAASTEFIFCDPECRGQGLAEDLLRYTLRALSKDGVDRILLTVYGKNEPAISLYRKLGYELGSVLIEMHYS